MHGHSYRNLALELILDFIIMYLVMYTMIATLDHFYFNLNNVYMTLMMVAPMTILMLVLMRSMYQNKRVNWAIGLGAVVVFAVGMIVSHSRLPRPVAGQPPGPGLTWARARRTSRGNQQSPFPLDGGRALSPAFFREHASRPARPPKARGQRWRRCRRAGCGDPERRE